MTIIRSARIVAAFALGFVLVQPGPAGAQSPQERLASVKTIACEFPLLSTGTWTPEGEAQGSVKPPDKVLTLRFNAINTDEGSAEMAGSYGKFDIIVRLSEGTLHLIQMFRTGPLYTTTVFPKVSRAGKLIAVHSRHEYTAVSLPGYTSRPEQYYGECDVR